MDSKTKELLYNILRQMQADLDDGAIRRVKQDLEELINKIVEHKSKVFDDDPLRLKEELQPKLSLTERRRIITRILNENKKYLTLSDKNRFREWKMVPERGIIEDYYGNKIADNIQTFQLHMVPEDVPNMEELFFRLSRIAIKR